MTTTLTRGAASLRSAGALDGSIVAARTGGLIGLRVGEAAWEVLAWTPAGDRLPAGLSGAVAESSEGLLLVGPADGSNAAALRALVPWLSPQRLGRGPSVGLGDRLGLATPGHVAALRANPGIMPVLAQQSARELARTGSSFADVLDATTFGALAAGWTAGFGADADHLRTSVDIDRAVAAGFSMITVDPIDVVPDIPADATPQAIEAAFGQVPWDGLEDDPGAFAGRYPAALDLGTSTLGLPRAALRAAAARFGPAVVRVVTMHRHLVGRLGGRDVDLEVAVDEIGHPTTHVDHVYLATELRRLGVGWETFAPRFVGRFEKGVDYIGDPDALLADITTHAAVAGVLGPYRLSIHSGSDKFSIYELAARATAGAVHVKTSGTSYLAALGILAVREPGLFREVWRIALDVYEQHRASYHVSATADRVHRPDAIPDADLPGLLVNRDSREILHVTYGAILGRSTGDDLPERFRRAIWSGRDTYWAELGDHIGRHLRPFVAADIVGMKTD